MVRLSDTNARSLVDRAREQRELIVSLAIQRSHRDIYMYINTGLLAILRHKPGNMVGSLARGRDSPRFESLCLGSLAKLQPSCICNIMYLYNPAVSRFVHRCTIITIVIVECNAISRKRKREAEREAAEGKKREEKKALIMHEVFEKTQANIAAIRTSEFQSANYYEILSFYYVSQVKKR